MTRTYKRQFKSDRLLSPGASPVEIECDYAVAPFDRATREMDLKWGVDRLPTLASPETARKFGSAMAKMNAAIEAGDPTETVARVGVCIRGLSALDQEAEAAGHAKADPSIWEYQLDGVTFAIMADGTSWPAIKAARPDLMLFTMREVALALKATSLTAQPVQSVKDNFPAATVTRITPRSQLSIDLDDEIPF